MGRIPHTPPLRKLGTPAEAPEPRSPASFLPSRGCERRKDMNPITGSSPTQNWIEAGAAFDALVRAGGIRASQGGEEELDVVVVGAGQAGLSAGRFLTERGLRYVVLDAHARVGDGWRQRWDSLHLFSPARFDGLDGLP